MPRYRRRGAASQHWRLDLQALARDLLQFALEAINRR